MTRPVCVLGLGLIGGSLLRAATDAGRPAWGYNRSPVAPADGYDVSSDLPATLRRAADADALVVVAVPMTALQPVLAAVAEHAPGCALTDAVSVKAPVAAAVAQHGLAARYVGGHPMAGTAHSGWAAGSATLFRDAAWVVAADDGLDLDVWRDVAQLALVCGAHVVPASAEEHDRAVAAISHLPHVLAAVLAAVGGEGGELALSLAAGSFRDGTRVAATRPELVQAMCEANRSSLLDALEDTLTRLTNARDSLRDNATLGSTVAAGHTARLRLDELHRTEVTDVDLTGPQALERLRALGRNGGMIRRL
ncbi:prephenate dehydrogenase [Rhodococcus sp. X156]|uniref:prephenate dehydrogenase n=1 Tax=Rhodococcus sp. X156 TaxID=2499145 RepID=UPI001F49C15B|nr:prephenate dehydrogenase [Rhodococcus sp. X156]